MLFCLNRNNINNEEEDLAKKEMLTQRNNKILFRLVIKSYFFLSILKCAKKAKWIEYPYYNLQFIIKNSFFNCLDILKIFTLYKTHMWKGYMLLD